MNYEITEESNSNHPLRAEVQRMLDGATATQVMQKWMSKPNSALELLPGIENETEEHTAIAIGFILNDQDPFFVYQPLKTALAEHPGLRPASDFVYSTRDDSFPWKTVDLDATRADQMLQIDREKLYDDVLCGDMLAPKDAFNFALMYGLCPYVRVSISEMHPEYLEECDTRGWKHHGKRILTVDANYRAPMVGKGKGFIPGFFDSIFTTLESWND